MCKTKLRSFLNNQVKPLETLKEKHCLPPFLHPSLSLFLFLSHTNSSNQHQKIIFKNTDF